MYICFFSIANFKYALDYLFYRGIYTIEELLSSAQVSVAGMQEFQTESGISIKKSCGYFLQLLEDQPQGSIEDCFLIIKGLNASDYAAIVQFIEPLLRMDTL